MTQMQRMTQTLPVTSGSHTAAPPLRRSTLHALNSRVIWSGPATSRVDALERAVHAAADLRGLVFRDEIVDDALALCDLDLRGAHLHRTSLRGTRMEHTRFDRGTLEHADLSRASLGSASFKDACLAYANLGGADLSLADLSRAHLKRASFNTARLAHANLSGADLTGADLTGAVLTGAVLTGTQFWKATVTTEQLRAADLSGVQADLRTVLNRCPDEVPALLRALERGRVDGERYEGTPSCLIGTLAAGARTSTQNYLNARPGLNRTPGRPAERWFLPITPGPQGVTSPFAVLAAEWIRAWLEERPAGHSPLN